MPSRLLDVRGVTKTYDASPTPLDVLKGVALELGEGEAVAVVGPSGCGKSTLLNLIGALDRPTAGSIAFDGRQLESLSPAELARFRNRYVGLVFQLHHLLPQCTAIENVLVPTLVNRDAHAPRERARALLERVGLAGRMDTRPGQLSGGERQRVAVVRALINGPRLLLADEPTGALNEEGAQDLMRLLRELNRDEGMALLVVTHSTAMAEEMDRVLELHNGVLVPRRREA
ncbi:MAG: ABC transporter ATP-binding protein [Candidatus Hydrogenedentes bacterium]|nr:ABC transporter ATP-binding protein [Candidatus Hydrogenedentota bacterium]